MLGGLGLAPLATLLVLHPVLEGDGPLRLVSEGADVEWRIDGAVVARTGPGQASVVQVAAGPHEVEASSPSRGAWGVLVRPELAHPGGAVLVPSWSAFADGTPAATAPGGRTAWLAPALLAAAGLALVAPWRLPKRP